MMGIYPEDLKNFRDANKLKKQNKTTALLKLYQVR